MKPIARVLFVVFLVAAPMHAQEPAPKAPQAAAQDGFVPVDSMIKVEDTMPAPRLVAIAYGFIWVVLFGYLWSIRTRLTTVEREMSVVSRRMASGGK